MHRAIVIAATLWLIASTIVFSIVSSPVYGADGYDGTGYPYSTIVTETGDYFVVIDVPSVFSAETDLCNDTASFWCAATQDGGNFTDSALWLYDATGALMTVNDDDPRANGQSWHSYISVELQAGVYRLRAGRFTCHDGSCLWPQDPFPVGGSYQLLTTTALLRDPNPPTVEPTAIPSILPTPEPTPEPTPDPTTTPEPTLEPTPEPSPTPDPTQTPEPPSPSPSVAPTPTPEPSMEPSPSPSPLPSPSPEPTPDPTPDPTASPEPTEEPTPSPEVTNEPTPDPTTTPEPTPEGTVEPTDSPEPAPSPDPTAVPSPEPTQPPLPDLGEVAAAVEEAVGAAAEAVSEAVGAAAEEVFEAVDAVADAAAEVVGEALAPIANLGNDISQEDKESARETVLPAIILTQIAQAASSAAAIARSSSAGPSGPTGGGSSGGGKGPKGPAARSVEAQLGRRKENA